MSGTIKSGWNKIKNDDDYILKAKFKNEGPNKYKLKGPDGNIYVQIPTIVLNNSTLQNPPVNRKDVKNLFKHNHRVNFRIEQKEDAVYVIFQQSTSSGPSFGPRALRAGAGGAAAAVGETALIASPPCPTSSGPSLGQRALVAGAGGVAVAGGLTALVTSPLWVPCAIVNGMVIVGASALVGSGAKVIARAITCLSAQDLTLRECAWKAFQGAGEGALCGSFLGAGYALVEGAEGAISVLVPLAGHLLAGSTTERLRQFNDGEERNGYKMWIMGTVGLLGAFVGIGASAFFDEYIAKLTILNLQECSITLGGMSEALMVVFKVVLLSSMRIGH